MENVQFLFIIAKMNSKNLKAQKINIFLTALLKIFVVPTQHKLTSQYNTIQYNTKKYNYKWKELSQSPPGRTYFQSS